MARALPISFVVGRLHGKETATVQAVVFPRPAWSAPAARAWLRRHGFAPSVEDTQRSLRALQLPAGQFRRGSLRTLHTAGPAAVAQLNPRRPRTLSVPDKDFRAAIALYRKFREAEPRKIAVRSFTVPRMLMQIGPVLAVEYFTTHKGGRETLYRHKFAPQAMPTLAASANGRALYFVGGHYDFTRDGIVDR